MAFEGGRGHGRVALDQATACKLNTWLGAAQRPCKLMTVVAVFLRGRDHPAKDGDASGYAKLHPMPQICATDLRMVGLRASRP
jgi:hypothetical protein